VTSLPLTVRSARLPTSQSFARPSMVQVNGVPSGDFHVTVLVYLVCMWPWSKHSGHNASTISRTRR